MKAVLPAAVAQGARSEPFCLLVGTLVNELLAKSVPLKRTPDVPPEQFMAQTVVRPMRQSNMFTVLDDPLFFADAILTLSTTTGHAPIFSASPAPTPTRGAAAAAHDEGASSRSPNARTVLSASCDDMPAPAATSDAHTAGGASRTATLAASSQSAAVVFSVPVLCRSMLLEALLMEVAANRLLEYRRVQTMRALTTGASTSLSIATHSSTAVHVGQPSLNVRKALEMLSSSCRAVEKSAAASSTASAGPSTPSGSGCPPPTLSSLQASLAAIVQQIPFDSLQPVLPALNRAQASKVEQIFHVLLEEYTLRRRTLITRLEATLSTFCDAPDAKIEKSALRLLCDECLRGIVLQPLLSIEHVRCFPKVGVLAAFAKISATHRMVFPLRHVVIPKVPDRGGRVNTFGFEDKVAVAVANADRDLARKYSSSNRGGGGGGGRTSNSSGHHGASPAAGRGDASHSAAPSANAHVDPNAVRGRGGRWSQR